MGNLDQYSANVFFWRYKSFEQDYKSSLDQRKDVFLRFDKNIQVVVIKYGSVLMKCNQTENDTSMTEMTIEWKKLRINLNSN